MSASTIIEYRKVQQNAREAGLKLTIRDGDDYMKDLYLVKLNNNIDHTFLSLDEVKAYIKGYSRK